MISGAEQRKVIQWQIVWADLIDENERNTRNVRYAYAEAIKD